MNVKSRERPISIAMLALGGQGGGVLTNWLVDLAESNAHLAQSTYIAGVAQRTGATVYYVEMLAETAADGREPVFSPTPIPGDVDLVIAGEMAETGRAIQRGFVTPERTTLIASSHRIYSVTEKSALGDGIVDQSKVAEIAEKVSRRYIAFDMQDVADKSGSVISSVLFGAIAASGALPFEREAFEATIRKSGRAVEASLSAFGAGYEAALDDTPQAARSEVPQAVPLGRNGAALANRVAAHLPAPTQNISLHGALRALDFQDNAYAEKYLEQIEHVARLDEEHGGERREYALTTEVARQLALQMCYEDTIRVADLKTRAERTTRIREQLAVTAEQPIRVYEYFHPRIEEVCDTLPRALGAFVLRSSTTQRLLRPLLQKGRTMPTTGIGGFFLLHMLAKFRRFRRSTYRYHTQRAHIEDWLRRISDALEEDYDLALSIAHCIEIVKGYGDTYERGLHRYRATVDAIDGVAATRRAEAVRSLHQAALADEEGRVFAESLARINAGAAS